MTTDTRVELTDTEPLRHDEAMDLQRVELQRTLALLDQLTEEDWQARTDCPAWDVRQMYLHVLGACEAAAKVRENVHQMRAAHAHRKAHGGPLEAGLSAVQVAEREHLSPAELTDRLRQVAPVTVAKRTKLPAPVRKLTTKVDGPVVERWSIGYLVDTIYLRDLWMHRIDAARATGREPELSADHDGRIVVDVAAEWGRRHRRPFELTLSGPAGGHYFGAGRPDASAEAAEGLELDAVEFCRVLAGREPATGLLETIVPF